MNALLQFYLNPRNNLIGQTATFFELCLIPIALAVVVGVVVGVLVYRNAPLSFVAVNVSNLIRAIPLLAVLFIFVPIFKIDRAERSSQEGCRNSEILSERSGS